MKFNSGAVKYKNVLPKTDLIYQVENGGLKETIIVNEKNTHYQYQFNMAVKEQNAKMSDNGEILIFDDEQIQYIISPAQIVDAAGERCFDVKYELIEDFVNGYYSLCIIPAADWINDTSRNFPIAIETNVKPYKQAAYEYATEYIDGKINRTDNTLYVGVAGDGNKYNSRLDFNLNGTIAGAALLSAEFKYNQTETSNTDITCFVAEYNEDELGINNFDTNPVYRYKKVKVEEHRSVNTVKLQNLGEHISLIFEPELNTLNGQYSAIKLSGENAAVLTLNYAQMMGLSDDYVMESFSSEGITNYVNMLSRQGTSVINYLNVKSNIMPLVLQGVYNADYSNLKTQLLTGHYTKYVPNFYGNNFKLNLEQYCVPYGDDYVYIDGDGTPHYMDISIGGTRHMCSDCGLIYDESSSYIIKDNFPTMKFSGGCLPI